MNNLSARLVEAIRGVLGPRAADGLAGATVSSTIHFVATYLALLASRAATSAEQDRDFATTRREAQMAIRQRGLAVRLTPALGCLACIHDGRSEGEAAATQLHLENVVRGLDDVLPVEDIVVSDWPKADK